MLSGHESVSSRPSDDLPDDLIEPGASENQNAAPETPPPPVGTTPPAELVELAAQGKRGAAWRLLHWIGEDNREAIEAIRRFPDQRLLKLLLEWLAVGTWGGKPFTVPRAMRQPHFRTQVSTFFLPGSGAPEGHVKEVLCAGLRHPQGAVRATAAHLLGVLGDPAAAPDLVEALRDPLSAVRVQAAKALGRLHVPQTAAALVSAFHSHDEALASQAHQALLQPGLASVPPLIAAAHAPDAWVRWQAVRTLGDLHDARGLAPLVERLTDSDHAVAWMAARVLASMGAPVVEEVLGLLLRAPDTPQLMETAAYVLRAQRNPQVKNVLAPVIRSMHDVDYRVVVPLEVQRALKTLAGSGVRSASG
ncbi:MAG TPA: HEAT repeat domain-containing protein [Ktedonobacterales bacterium]|jgi:hypothetical protein